MLAKWGAGASSMLSCCLLFCSRVHGGALQSHSFGQMPLEAWPGEVAFTRLRRSQQHWVE